MLLRMANMCQDLPHIDGSGVIMYITQRFVSTLLSSLRRTYYRHAPRDDQSQPRTVLEVLFPRQQSSTPSKLVENDPVKRRPAIVRHQGNGEQRLRRGLMQLDVHMAGSTLVVGRLQKLRESPHQLPSVP
jgi:hypothetical protein